MDVLGLMEQIPGGDPAVIREIFAWCRRSEYVYQLFNKMYERHGGSDDISVLHLQMEFITNHQGHALICRFNEPWSSAAMLCEWINSTWAT